MRGMRKRLQRRRPGAILLLAAFLMVLMLVMIAFAVDIGNIVLARTQLQTAADSAALAAAASIHLPREEMEGVANRFAGYNHASGRPVQLKSSDIEYGTWDTATRTFTPSGSVGNAVRVTARTASDTGGETKLFFAPIFGRNSVGLSASAVATTNPRDIAFVVDLSGSMNDDTDPNNTDDLNNRYADQGYATIGTDLMQQVYDDFGFNVTFPGTTRCAGYTVGVSGSNPMSTLSSSTSPLRSLPSGSPYKITSSDTKSQRTKKAYSYVMDLELKQVVPAARPTPNSTSTASYNYWYAYISGNSTQLGYRSYTHYMMYYGRDERPDGATYTPLSRSSPDCPYHQETTAGGTFSFPPREQPTHAARRAMIAAIQVIKERNQNISDMNQRDRVSIITFDKSTAGTVELTLTGDYDAAMQACTTLQACGSGGYSTTTEAGLITARNHIKPQSEGGSGRNAANKVVVLLTDGQPNLYVSSSTTIDQFISSNANADFYSSGQYAKQAPLMQTLQMQMDRWYVYPVGIGLDTDYDFMDRMGRMGSTADSNGLTPRGSGNPADYEARLAEIFQNIITNPKLRLVQ